MKTRYIFTLIMLAAMAMAPFANAQEEGAAAPVVDYFNIAAEVHVPEEGARDVFGFGPIVDINNPVEQDVVAVAGTVIIQAPVEGDVRVGANRVLIEANIGGNVAIVAQRVEIAKESVISGSVQIKAQEVIVNGIITGDANITARTLAQNGVISGELTHNALARPQKQGAFYWFLRVVSLFGMLVTGLVLVSFAPKIVRAAVSASIKNPTRDIMWGIISLILAPITALVLVLTVIGLPLGIILGFGILVALYLAKIMVGIVLGTYLLGAFRGRDKAQKSSLLITMVIGVLVLWLIIGIPVIGGVLKLLAMVWGLGMIVRLKMFAFKKLEA